MKKGTIFLISILFGLGALWGCTGNKDTVRIASKNFTEQFLLGEIMAQLLEAKTDLDIKRVFNLGGTMICHNALLEGNIDLYAEYTGTGLTAVLNRQVVGDPARAYQAVQEAYRSQFNLEWLAPFGFNNTYTLAVQRQEAERRGWRQISDLAPSAEELRAGFTAEFMERPDGYPGLRRAYEFGLGEVRDMDPGLMYQAIANDAVDVISAFSTDGRIPAYDLLPLEDDKQFFPPYYAAPVIRADTLAAHPEIKEVLALLAGRLDEATMQRLNFEVDENKRLPKEVAREFLQNQGLLTPRQ